MKLSLLVGANPKVSEGGPRVKLHAGVWRIVSDAVDSILSVTHGEQLNITESASVQVGFAKRGTERSISVYAELVPQV
jgi:hypothetical protein